MKIVISIAIFIAAIYFIFLRNQNSGLSFWKKAQKNSMAAYAIFLNSDDWYVDDGVNNLDQPDMNDGDWDGPFRLNVPHIGMINIYGKVGFYEESQKKFEDSFKSS